MVNYKEFGSTSRLIFELAMVGSSIFMYLGYRRIQRVARMLKTKINSWKQLDWFWFLFKALSLKWNLQKMLENELTTFWFKNFEKLLQKLIQTKIKKGFNFVFSFSRVGIQNLISKVFCQKRRIDLKRVLKYKRFKKIC